MSDIKVNIVGEFQKKGFDDADKAVTKLTKGFQKLGAAVGVALSGRALFNFAKQGAIAFAAEEKAIKQLTNALSNLGFAYAVPGLERYLEATELATMVTKEEMRPAIVNLISTTMDAEMSMKLLGTAIDASVETGQDLVSITNAITRAYSGNYAAISKLTRGYSSAQLKALGFDKTVKILAERFEGSAAASVDSYSFKIAQLQKAVGDAQKAMGEGLIKAVEQLGSGDYDQGLQDLVDFGNDIGKAFGYAAGAVQSLKEAYDLITLRSVRDATMSLLGKTPASRGGSITPTQFELAKANVERQKELTLQKKILNERKKAVALTEKEKKDQLALNKAKAVFDLDKIQIEAALKGKITEEERTRLLLMRAILNEDEDKAAKLTERLKEMQNDTMKLANMLTTFPKANDPFTDWMESLNKITGALGGILALTNAQTMAAQSYASAAAAALAAGDMYAAQGTALTSTAEAEQAVKAAQEALGAAKTPSEAMGAQSFLDAANGALEAANAIAESASALALGAAAAEMVASANLLGESIASTQQTGAYAPNVVVNVAGTVVSDRDLQEAVLEGLYEVQKRGQTITLSAVGL